MAFQKSLHLICSRSIVPNLNMLKAKPSSIVFPKYLVLAVIHTWTGYASTRLQYQTTKRTNHPNQGNQGNQRKPTNQSTNDLLTSTAKLFWGFPEEWSDWSSFSPCSVSCGCGRKKRALTCPMMWGDGFGNSHPMKIVGTCKGWLQGGPLRVILNGPITSKNQFPMYFLRPFIEFI